MWLLSLIRKRSSAPGGGWSQLPDPSKSRLVRTTLSLFLHVKGRGRGLHNTCITPIACVALNQEPNLIHGAALPDPAEGPGRDAPGLRLRTHGQASTSSVWPSSQIASLPLATGEAFPVAISTTMMPLLLISEGRRSGSRQETRFPPDSIPYRRCIAVQCRRRWPRNGSAGTTDLAAHHGHERTVGRERTVPRVGHASVATAEQDLAWPSGDGHGPHLLPIRAACVDDRGAVRRELDPRVGMVTPSAMFRVDVTGRHRGQRCRQGPQVSAAAQ